MSCNMTVGLFQTVLLVINMHRAYYQTLGLFSFFELYSDSFLASTNAYEEDSSLQLLNVMLYAYKVVSCC